MKNLESDAFVFFDCALLKNGGRVRVTSSFARRDLFVQLRAR
jgi:hypothetical protein